MGQTIKVGTLTVTKPLEVTNHFECADWFQKVRVEPGTYDLMGCATGEGYFCPSEFWASVPGLVTAASFRSRIGAHYGRDEGPEMVGKPAAGTIRIPSGGNAEEPWPRYSAEDGLIVSLDDAAVVRRDYSPRSTFEYWLRRKAG